MRVSSGVQPVLLVIDPNHRFVERDLIRRSPGLGLEIGFLAPIVDRFSAAVDTQVIEQLGGIRQWGPTMCD